MNTKIAAEQSMADTVKLASALILIAAAIIAYYYFGDESKLARVGGLLATIAVSLVIVLQTDKGRALAGFVKEAQIEVHKVVWPTRQETIQTTLLVFVFVLIIALFLWGLDSLLGFVVSRLMG